MTEKQRDKQEKLKNNIPLHLAIIMDGNGRWAKQRGKIRTFGHYNAIETVKETVQTSARIGVKYLTLFAFSKDNWHRPSSEIKVLLQLFKSVLNKELNELNKNNIKLNVIGDLKDFPKDIQTAVNKVVLKTKDNNQMILTVALSYSGREEILRAMKEVSQKVKNNLINPEEINISTIKHHLYTHDLPDVDLLIRTSGEQRISDFMIWQTAYTEFYFSDVLWPDFSKEHLMNAIADYQKRERRFGKTGEQITQNLHA